MKERLNNLYCLEPALIERSSVGAGSDTYFVTCADGKYVVKFPALSEINHPGAEPELCEYLNHHIYLHQAIFSTKLLRWLEEDSAVVKPLDSS